MSALLFASLVAAFLIGLVKLDAIAAPLAAGLFAVMCVAWGVLVIASEVKWYLRKQRKNRDAFVREVVRQHQRANEARQASDRA